MSKLLLNFTCILITVLALNGCDRSSIPTSPIDSESVTPTEVANLKATIVDESKILLTWEDEALNERGFEIFERSGSESEFILLMRTAANVTTVLIDKHRRAFDYYYKVRAINGIGASGFSDQAHVVGFQKAVTVSGSGSLRDITFSPDGSQIAGVGSWQTSTDQDADFGNLGIANASSGELIHLLETSSNYPYSGSSCLSYSPDGGTLTLGNELGEIECWDAINGELIISEMIMPRKDYWHWWGSGVSDLTYSNNGRFIVVAENDDDISSIAILRANSLKLYYPKLNFSGMIADFEFSPDSYMLAVLVDGGSNKGVLSLHRAEDGMMRGCLSLKFRAHHPYPIILMAKH
jgi:WD40 repeat protein